MIEQYMTLKVSTPDSLLFYRMGEFYELFFDDAITAAQELNITLTKRGKYLGKDIPMCGVPVHSADDYIRKLILAGHRIAICEQTENPSEAKKRGKNSIIKRNITRLVTPGTLTEETFLNPSQANYLMSLVSHNGHQCALAWIDISIGTFRVLETDVERLLADITRIDPQELITTEDILHNNKLQQILKSFDSILSPQSPIFFDQDAAEKRISHYYNLSKINQTSFTPLELSAISAAIAYIEKTQIKERPPLKFPEREEQSSTLFIDSATRLNLEIVRTLSGKREGSLITAIDRTLSSSGARTLIERLISPLTNKQHIEERLDSIAFFLKETNLCKSIRLEIKGLPDMARGLSRISLGRSGPRDFSVILHGLQKSQNIKKMFAHITPPEELKREIHTLNCLPHCLLSHLKKALADELPFSKRDGGFICSGYNIKLDEMRTLKNESRRFIAALQNRYASEINIKSLKIKHNNILGFFIEIPLSQSKNLPETHFIHRQSIANAARFTTSELVKLETRIANAAEKALSIELEIFDLLTANILSYASLLRQNAEALCVLDVSTSLAILAEEQGYCRPTIDNSLIFKIIGGRHPIVEQALRQQDARPFIANDCNLSPDQNNSLGSIRLLTGPNMGGKSTFLRQNALITIMAQMGSFVPARSAHIGIVTRLFSRVGASDNLAHGHSTFMVEMVETAAILNQADQRSLIILDEIGRGTSTFDGLAIAWATLEYIHEFTSCRTIFATHFHELTQLAKTFKRLYNNTMKVKEWNGNVIFLHEVSIGTADRSYGIQVAKLAGLPTVVIDRARDILLQLEKSEMPMKTHNQNPLLSSQKACLISQTLEGLNPNDLTPREALNKLYSLKHLYDKSKYQNKA
ncbi:MAG: DNA mismatch repair protein MutS [Candidatus Tokpelaia sp. JSC161]|nr:MAG: DNA mismatch repair protein MutS [Candidatus Tokpelaia sp. JSC161]